MTVRLKRDLGSLDDPALARLVAARDPDGVRWVMQRNNQRLFRAAWSILRNRAEAEDAVQSGYLRAFAAIGSFAGRSSLSTWLTRIVINEALGRQRKAKRRREQLEGASVAMLDDYREKTMGGSMTISPDRKLAREQIRSMLEQAVGELPAPFRIVFFMREVEGLSVEETAETLGLVPATVKTRHLRARRRLQQALEPDLKAVLEGAFPFAGPACAGMTERVAGLWCRGRTH